MFKYDSNDIIYGDTHHTLRLRCPSAAVAGRRCRHTTVESQGHRPRRRRGPKAGDGRRGCHPTVAITCSATAARWWEVVVAAATPSSAAVAANPPSTTRVITHSATTA